MNTKLQLLLLSFLAILAPVKGMVLITIFFIWVDLIAGIWRSKKLKLPLRSRGFARTISKTLLYAGGIVSVFTEVALSIVLQCVVSNIKSALSSGALT